MNKKLKILLTSSAFFTLAGGLFGPIYAIFVENWVKGGSILLAGNAYAAFSISAGMLLFFVSRWEDKIKHKEKLVVFGWVLSCLGYLGYITVSHTQEPIHLILVQALFGIGTAIGNPAYDSIYSENLDRGKFASEWGLWESMTFIIGALAAVTGGYLATIWNFQALFIIMFFVSLIGLSISILLFKN